MVLATVLVAVAAFGAGIASDRYLFQSDATDDQGSAAGAEDADIARIVEVMDLLDTEYYYGPIDRQDSVYDALDGMVNGLPDDYTVFQPPAQPGQAAGTPTGADQGIGIWLESLQGRLTVVAPMRGSPAERAGVQAGDVIVAIDGVPVDGHEQGRAIALLRGPDGAPVQLRVERPGSDEPIDVVVERATAALPAVLYTLLDGGIAHITVTIFGDRTTAELDQALASARADGARGIVLDLRNDGGGWVTAAQETVGRFVPGTAGPAYYEDQSRTTGMRTPQPIIEAAGGIDSQPMVVLVNGGTASAGEIVAGALRDYQRAVLVGTRTFGKGSLQRVHQFSDGSSLRVTVAEWLTPSGGRIQGQGIAPGMVVEGAIDPTGGDDPQLETAVAILRDALEQASVPSGQP